MMRSASVNPWPDHKPQTTTARPIGRVFFYVIKKAANAARLFILARRLVAVTLRAIAETFLNAHY